MRHLFFLLSIAALLAGCGQSETPTQPASQQAAPDDYLSAELRREVEALKRSVEENPTDASNAVERARTVFHWINAHAMRGGYVPVNATAVISRINAYGVPSGEVLDAYIAELTLHDERPGAVGELELSQAEPFVVREYATFSQTYIVGGAPVTDGGGFLAAKHFQTNHPPFQVTDPSAANYLSIESDNPDVSFVHDMFDVAGMHGGFRGAAGQHVFRVEGTLQPGDRVTLTYGDTRGGGPGLLMPNFESDQMAFPVYVDLDGSDLWLSLPIQGVEVIGAEAADVAGFAPSVVAAGETCVNVRTLGRTDLMRLLP